MGKISSDGHIPFELLSAWFDGEIEESDRQQIADHLHTCAQCQHELQQIANIQRKLRKQRELDPGTRVVDAVAFQIRRGVPMSQRKISTGIAIGSLAGLAAAVAIIFGFVTIFHSLASGTKNPVATATTSVVAKTPPIPTPSVQPITPTSTLITSFAPQLTIYDAASFSAIPIAALNSTNLYYSVHGGSLQSAPLPHPTGYLLQILGWSADQTRLMVGTDTMLLFNTQTGKFEDMGIPSIYRQSGPFFSGCPCQWIGNRYFAFMQQVGKYTENISIIDTTTHALVSLPTFMQQQIPIDTTLASDGTSLYFLDAGTSFNANGNTCTRAALYKFTPSTDTLAEVFELKNALIFIAPQGAIGSIPTSPSYVQAVIAPITASVFYTYYTGTQTFGCLPSAQDTTIYQNAAGATTVLQGHPAYNPNISLDGTSATILTGTVTANTPSPGYTSVNLTDILQFSPPSGNVVDLKIPTNVTIPAFPGMIRVPGSNMLLYSGVPTSEGQATIQDVTYYGIAPGSSTPVPIFKIQGNVYTMSFTGPT